MRPEPRNALLFFAIALALAIGIRFLVPLIGDGALLATMLTPAAAVLIMLYVVAPEPEGATGAASRLGLTRLGAKGLVPAFTVPWLIHIAGLAVLTFAGLSTIDASPFASDGPRLIFKAMAGLLIGTAFALAEEIGWRGYMLPRLAVLGTLPAMLLVGFLHGVWHLPLLLTTNLYHAAGNPALVALLFLITLTLAGIFYGFLRLWTGSIVPVAFAHATTNMAWEMTGLASTSSSTMATEYVGGESGAVMITGLLAIDAILIGFMVRNRMAFETPSDPAKST